MLTLKSYKDLAASCTGGNLVQEIPGKLARLWTEDYSFTNPKADLVTVDLSESGSTFSYLFDIDLQRIVVASGVPISVHSKRDASRQKGFPDPGKGFAKGHLIAHSLGGGMDINFVPQLSSMNQGAFRKIENLAKKEALNHMTSLYFVRSIYSNDSQIPQKLEQCLIHPSGTIDYQLHTNS